MEATHTLVLQHADFIAIGALLSLAATDRAVAADMAETKGSAILAGPDDGLHAYARVVIEGAKHDRAESVRIAALRDLYMASVV